MPAAQEGLIPPSHSETPPDTEEEEEEEEEERVYPPIPVSASLSVNAGGPSMTLPSGSGGVPFSQSALISARWPANNAQPTAHHVAARQPVSPRDWRA